MHPSLIRRGARSAAPALVPLVALAALARPALAQSPGDIAIIGWYDAGSPDAYAFVALAPIPAGTDVYFTDNGWTGTQFRGATATSGVGNEQVLKWSAINTVAAGTIVRTTDTSSDYAWVTGPIGGGVSGSYSLSALSQNGDQLCAFTSSAPNALFNPATHLFVLDDSGAFEPATTSNEGDVPPGLTAGLTAVTFSQFTPSGTNSLNFMAFNTSALSCGTKADWLAAIANGANWTFGATGTLPSGSIFVGPCCGATASYCTAGTTSSGCNAAISGAGTPSASLTSGFTLTVSGAEPNQTGLIFYGVSGAVAQPWGTGSSFLCVKSPLERTGTQPTGGSAGNCDGAMSIDWNAYVASTPGAQGTPFLGGETVWAQGWFRDPPSPKTTSLSDALTYTVCP